MFVVDVAAVICGRKLVDEEEKGDEKHTLTATESGRRDVAVTSKKNPIKHKKNR
jgi:hypothetical protein